jgi:hypothetical protein
VDAGAAERDAGPRGLLRLDGAVLEGGDAGPAVLLGYLDAEESQGSELAVEVPGHDARVEPLLVMRHDLGLDKGPQGLAERFVVFVEHRTAHVWFLPAVHTGDALIEQC